MDTGSMYLICCLGSKMLSFSFVPEIKKETRKNPAVVILSGRDLSVIFCVV
jgi:hypothetical protein